MKFNLIIPIAADKPEYRNTIPYLFSKGNDGIIVCLKSIMGLNLIEFDNIFFTILRIHENLYSLKEKFNDQFKILGIEQKASVVILDSATSSQPETIAKTLMQKSIVGSIMIKDADSYFICNAVAENSVATFPLDALSRVNPQDKSYVTVDEMFNITNIIEKKIINNLFCAGGYVFKEANDFLRYYDRLKSYAPLCMSNIVYAMLLDKFTFSHFPVKGYKDWGTKEDWLFNS